MSPRTTLPERRKQETRQRILDAAYAVFVRRGYGAASVDEIIAEADVSKGALYHHFAGKDEMFREILAGQVRRCAEQMAGAIDADAPIWTNVENVLRASWETVQSDPAWPALQMEFWVHATRDEHAREIVAESFVTCRELAANFVRALQEAGIARREIDPESAARMFIGVNDGILLQWQVEPRDVHPEKLVVPMAEMMVRYLIDTDGQHTRLEAEPGP